MKNRYIPIFVFIPLFLITISCSRQEKAEWKGTIEEVDGVLIVKNPKEAIFDQEAFELREDLTINSENPSEGILFELITSIRVDDDESIYVQDARARKIKIFDKEGKLLREFGNRGQGPGEFQTPRFLQLLSQNKLKVFDMSNKRISIFSLNGDLIQEISTASVPSGFFRLIMDSQGECYGTTVGFKRDGLYNQLKKYDAELNEALDIYERLMFPHQPGATNMFQPDIIFGLLQNDLFVWGDCYDYSLHVIDKDGNEVKTIQKECVPQRFSEADKIREIEELKATSSLPDNRKFNFQEKYPDFEHFLIDDEDRIYVRTYQSYDGKREYHIYDSEGRYIANVYLAFMPRVIKKNKLYSIEEDSEGRQFIKRYRIFWKLNI